MNRAFDGDVMQRKANPGCVAWIDNDCWTLFKTDPNTDAEGTAEELADSDDEFEPPLGDGGYGSGNSYGGDILQALAIIAGVKVASV